MIHPYNYHNSHDNLYYWHNSHDTPIWLTPYAWYSYTTEWYNSHYTIKTATICKIHPYHWHNLHDTSIGLTQFAWLTQSIDTICMIHHHWHYLHDTPIPLTQSAYHTHACKHNWDNLHDSWRKVTCLMRHIKKSILSFTTQD